MRPAVSTGEGTFFFTAYPMVFISGLHTGAFFVARSPAQQYAYATMCILFLVSVFHHKRVHVCARGGPLQRPWMHTAVGWVCSTIYRT